MHATWLPSHPVSRCRLMQQNAGSFQQMYLHARLDSLRNRARDRDLYETLYWRVCSDHTCGRMKTVEMGRRNRSAMQSQLKPQRIPLGGPAELLGQERQERGLSLERSATNTPSS